MNGPVMLKYQLVVPTPLVAGSKIFNSTSFRQIRREIIKIQAENSDSSPNFGKLPGG
jgi:hypothetical protein